MNFEPIILGVAAFVIMSFASGKLIEFASKLALVPSRRHQGGILDLFGNLCFLTCLCEFFQANALQKLSSIWKGCGKLKFPHPLYYFSYRIWWAFAVAGVALLAASLFLHGLVAYIVAFLGITCLWCIVELFHQKRRVEKGWYPQNPKRTKREQEK